MRSSVMKQKEKQKQTIMINEYFAMGAIENGIMTEELAGLVIIRNDFVTEISRLKIWN
jgi:hypothetical protein